jgi:hypothetical protein
MIRIQRLLTEITQIESIAVGREIRELRRLKGLYGNGKWRKMKGVATIETQHGEVLRAEVHWYEAHGIGKREMRVKHALD